MGGSQSQRTRPVSVLLHPKHLPALRALHPPPIAPLPSLSSPLCALAEVPRSLGDGRRDWRLADTPRPVRLRGKGSAQSAPSADCQAGIGRCLLCLCVLQRRPFFVLVVQEKRSPRNSGARLEDVGWWDPNPCELPGRHTHRMPLLSDGRGLACACSFVALPLHRLQRRMAISTSVSRKTELSESARRPGTPSTQTLRAV